MARWGMPAPPQFGGAPFTNIRKKSAECLTVTNPLNTVVV